MIKEFVWYKPSEYEGHLLHENVDYVDEVSMEFELPNGKNASLSVNWYDLNERHDGYAAKLEVFEDAWHLLEKDFIELFIELASENVQPEEFVEKLKEMGFNDETPYGNGRCPHCYNKMS